MPKVEFEREGLTVEARAGQTLLEVAEGAGIDVFRGIWPTLHCGTRTGWCNRCKVWVRADDGAAVNPPTAKERARLRLNGRVGGDLRLACQVELRGDVRVHTRAGGPTVRPSLAGGAPAWKNALSQRPAPEKPAASDNAAAAKPATAAHAAAAKPATAAHAADAKPANTAPAADAKPATAAHAADAKPAGAATAAEQSSGAASAPGKTGGES